MKTSYLVEMVCPDMTLEVENSITMAVSEAILQMLDEMQQAQLENRVISNGPFAGALVISFSKTMGS